MDVDGVAVANESEGEYPAYAAWGHETNDNKSPYDCHCAGFNEFCFFCEYQNGGCPDDTGADLRQDLAEMAHGMLQNKKEPRVVAKAVSKAYLESIKPYVDFIDGSGMRVASPEWSLASIERHLMFSTEFTTVFTSWLERSHQAMLVRLGSTLVTTEGRICPIASKQFALATKSYIDLQKALKSSAFR